MATTEIMTVVTAVVASKTDVVTLVRAFAVMSQEPKKHLN